MGRTHHIFAKNKGRTSTSLSMFSLDHSVIALLSFLPAFIIYGCKSYSPENTLPVQEEISTFILKSSAIEENIIDEGSDVDIFMFNDDALRRIDSYQRIKAGESGIVTAGSRKGKKIAAVIVNPQQIEYDWGDISSFESLLEMCAELCEEDPEHPLMSGIIELEAEEDGYFEMEVKPLFSIIHIRSIRCDFSGRPYMGAELENACAYLSNVNSMAKIFMEEDHVPTAPINTDGYPDESLLLLDHPELIHAEFPDAIGTATVEPDINLMCYPNNSGEDSAGTPYTRLVIAGDINGHKYYYPININRGEFGTEGNSDGVGRYCRYVMDITITQTGSDSPLLPVSPEVVKIRTEIMPWYVKPEAIVEF